LDAENLSAEATRLLASEVHGFAYLLFHATASRLSRIVAPILLKQNELKSASLDRHFPPQLPKHLFKN
jgi:hypothetical protein